MEQRRQIAIGVSGQHALAIAAAMLELEMLKAHAYMLEKNHGRHTLHLPRLP